MTRRSAFQTVSTWTVCVGSGVGTYAVFSGAASGWAIAAIIGGIIGLIVIVTTINLVITNRRLSMFMRDSNEGVAALARGELQRARDIFWRWAEDAPVPRASALARHNLGWTLMRQGELQQAIAVLTDNESSHPTQLKQISMYPTSAADLALNYALAGQLEEAERWYSKAEERSSETCAPGYPAMKVYARAVLDCRKGNSGEASRLLDERWAECEASLTGEVVRPIRVVRSHTRPRAHVMPASPRP
jgi:tetratricopeptide (TPR) repeat protein